MLLLLASVSPRLMPQDPHFDSPAPLPLGDDSRCCCCCCNPVVAVVPVWTPAGFIGAAMTVKRGAFATRGDARRLAGGGGDDDPYPDNDGGGDPYPPPAEAMLEWPPLAAVPAAETRAYCWLCHCWYWPCGVVGSSYLPPCGAPADQGAVGSATSSCWARNKGGGGLCGLMPESSIAGARPALSREHAFTEMGISYR